MSLKKEVVKGIAARAEEAHAMHNHAKFRVSAAGIAKERRVSALAVQSMLETITPEECGIEVIKTTNAMKCSYSARIRDRKKVKEFLASAVAQEEDSGADAHTLAVHEAGRAGAEDAENAERAVVEAKAPVIPSAEGSIRPRAFGSNVSKNGTLRSSSGCIFAREGLKWSNHLSVQDSFAMARQVREYKTVREWNRIREASARVMQN